MLVRELVISCPAHITVGSPPALECCRARVPESNTQGKADRVEETSCEMMAKLQNCPSVLCIRRQSSLT